MQTLQNQCNLFYTRNKQTANKTFDLYSHIYENKLKVELKLIPSLVNKLFLNNVINKNKQKRNKESTKSVGNLRFTTHCKVKKNIISKNSF